MRVKAAIKDFLELEAAGGVLLVAAAALALVWANLPIGDVYEGLLATPVEVRVGPLQLAKPLLLWINDGLMAVFFLLVGLEIKRELLAGELSTARRAALPAIAALGGMAAPAAIYATLAAGDPLALRGWAIPTATDIAFALGVLALLGPRVPGSLKIFLLGLAILDDLGAILVIAIFYTSDLSLLSLGLAGVGLVGLFALNRAGVTRLAPYVLVGLFLWVCVLKSGVHATLAGVAVGLAVPLRARDADGEAPLARLEHALHPWVAFGILPLFAFANAGVPLAGVTAEALTGPVPLGIALGLFLGKQVGVFGASWLAIRLRVADRPQGASWAQLYGVAVLTGIGFTMSLFIGMLAFPGGDQAASVRVGVLSGSIVSAVAGWAILRALARRTAASSDANAAPAPAPGEEEVAG